MSLNVKYNKGAQMAMTLCVYSPYEGWKISITGSKGRLEAEEFRTGVHSKDHNQYIRVYHNDNTMDEYCVTKGEIKLTNDAGIANYTLLGHNGGDVLLRRMLFIGDIEDKLNQMAGMEDAVDSVLVGSGAVKSIYEGREIKLKDLLQHEIID
jgi:hypothetical protein